jgi:DNA-binding CsgD family transcriptional regulator
VRIVAGGDALLSPAVTRRVLAAAARSAAAQPERLADLTDRERDVLAQVGAGRSNAEIGKILHISPDTARTYVGRLLGKLDARDRSQLVVIAYESGLVRPGDQ